ncbi:nucleotide sugar dehydrogenase [Oscillospiraceae bacterium PP1C4]
MNLHQKIINREIPLAVIGLGYVGMPLAVEFAKQIKVIGYDIKSSKIEAYKNGIDLTNEVGNEALEATTVNFTSDSSALKDAKVFIVAVPTPINPDKTPDLNPVIEATKEVGRSLSEGSIVIYESTVFPGTTEEICIPLLEEASGLKCCKDFEVGYSPERINPSDQVHTLRTITKIVSATSEDSLAVIASLYALVVDAPIYKVSSIKVAEAAKVVENSQRDINIAFMNELAMVLDRMGIETGEVIDAMNTKWNALGFAPGLVGGHCIGIDPYYFIYKAEQLGYHSQIILSGRKINDDMAGFVAQKTIKKLIEAGKKVLNARVAVLGITFKENCPDIRNSKVVDVIDQLKDYGINVLVCDPLADPQEAITAYGQALLPLEQLCDLDAIVLAVPHEEYRRLRLDALSAMFGTKSKVLIDVKGIIHKKEAEKEGFFYWSL